MLVISIIINHPGRLLKKENHLEIYICVQPPTSKTCMFAKSYPNYVPAYLLPTKIPSVVASKPHCKQLSGRHLTPRGPSPQSASLERSACPKPQAEKNTPRCAMGNAGFTCVERDGEVLNLQIWGTPFFGRQANILSWFPQV